MKLTFLFPGQGSQVPNMLRNLPDHQVITETLEEASEILNESVFNFDTEEALRSTVSVQLSLLIAGVAASRVFRAESVVPDLVGGHSVGAFGAAVTAGVLKFEDALNLVKARGELMEKAYPKNYGMGVILGMNEKDLGDVIKKLLTEEHPVYLANLNSPDQITIAGSITGIQKVIDYTSKNGARKAELLNVSIPSHCKLLDSVSLLLDEKMKDIDFSNPVIPYAANQTARILYTAEDIRHDLAKSVASSVRWHDASSILYELGTRLFIEMPPGNVLTKLADNAFCESRSMSIDEAGLNNCLFLAQRFQKNN